MVLRLRLLGFEPVVKADDDLGLGVGDGVAHHTYGLELRWIVHDSAFLAEDVRYVCLRRRS